MSKLLPLTILLITLLSLVACKTWYKPGADEEVLTTDQQHCESDTRGSTQPRQLGGWAQFGADTEQLEDAREQCGEADVSSESFNECMESKGWHQLRIRISVEEPGELD